MALVKLPYTFHSERWKNRRKLVFTLFYTYIAFISVVIFTLLVSVLFNKLLGDSIVELVTSIFAAFSTLVGAVVMGYLFGAIWDDYNFKDQMKSDKTEEKSSGVPTEG